MMIEYWFHLRKQIFRSFSHAYGIVPITIIIHAEKKYPVLKKNHSLSCEKSSQFAFFLPRYVHFLTQKQKKTTSVDPNPD